MFKRQKAFTLSELLVSLALLGLIAAISIPSVYNSVKTQREKAVWKETISTLSTLYMEAAMNGKTSNAHAGSYVINNANTTKVCLNNMSTEGCYFDSGLSGSTQRGFELHNGAAVCSISSSSSSVSDEIYIDINKEAGSNTVGEDQILLRVCTDDGCSINRSILGNVEPYGWDSVLLYNEIFGVN